MRLVIGPRVREKLASRIPPILESEIDECFENRLDAFLVDTREEHKTRPPTLWFIGETNRLRRLKVVFILKEPGVVVIKTVYEPDETEEWIYEQETRQIKD